MTYSEQRSVPHFWCKAAEHFSKMRAGSGEHSFTVTPLESQYSMFRDMTKTPSAGGEEIIWTALRAGESEQKFSCCTSGKICTCVKSASRLWKVRPRSSWTVLQHWSILYFKMKTWTDFILYIPPLITGCFFVLNYTTPSPRQSVQGVYWSIETQKVSSYPGRVSYFVSQTVYTKAAGTPHHSSPQKTEIKPLFLTLCWAREAAYS